jgi:flavin reductase (DIM6/NTAB) family NADH-FMN oxidoreductase RutF
VINVPSVELVDEVVGIGNCSGDKVDKFERFHLTPVQGAKVTAPLFRECFVNLVHQVSDWGSGAAAYFGWMREAKRENTRCGL